MSRDIVWISKLVALRVHVEQLELHGGQDGFLNEHHLDAALDRARTVVGYVPDISVEELAARMAVGIANGHPFVDGVSAHARLQRHAHVRLQHMAAGG